MITSLFLSTHLWRLTSLFALSLSLFLSLSDCRCRVIAQSRERRKMTGQLSLIQKSKRKLLIVFFFLKATVCVGDRDFWAMQYIFFFVDNASADCATEKMFVWFLSILFGYFFLSCRRNGIVEQCEHGGRRRPQDRETPPSASSPSFFLSSFFSILPLGGRRLLNALTTQRPTALCSSSASSHLRFFFTTTTASSTCVQCFKRIKDGG